MNSETFIDIHTHLNRTEREIISVQNAGPGDNIEVFSGKNFYSVGLHPWFLKSPDENDKMLEQVEETVTTDNVIFVGETGLDKRCNTDFEEQKRIFEAQIVISEKMNKPLIIHCVRAYNEILEMYKKMNPKMTWIFHGYNGSIEMTRQLAIQNFMFSFGEILFLPGTKAIESFKYLPLNKIFFETDENTDNVEQMYRQGAMLKRIPIEEFKKATWENFVSFKIKQIARINNKPQ